MNETLASYRFLQALYKDSYYPDHLLDKGKAILLRLCERIETVAREEIAESFWAVTNAYGFADVDIEKVIATRNW